MNLDIIDFENGVIRATRNGCPKLYNRDCFEGGHHRLTNRYIFGMVTSSGILETRWAAATDPDGNSFLFSSKNQVGCILEPRYEYSKDCLQPVEQIKIVVRKPHKVSFPVLQSKRYRMNRVEKRNYAFKPQSPCVERRAHQ